MCIPGKIADSSVEVVAWDSVISAPLDVEGGQVHAGVGLLLVLKQVVGYLVRDKLDKSG